MNGNRMESCVDENLLRFNIWNLKVPGCYASLFVSMCMYGARYSIKYASSYLLLWVRSHWNIMREREIWRAKVMCKRNSATTTATPLVNFVILPEIPNHNEWMYRFCVSRTTLCIYASLNACAIFCGVKKRKIDFIWNVRIFCTLAVSLLGFVGFSGWAWYLLPSNQYHATSNFPTITMPTYSCLWAEYYNVSTVAMALDSTLFVVNSQTNSEHVTLMRQKRAHVDIFISN